MTTRATGQDRRNWWFSIVALYVASAAILVTAVGITVIAVPGLRLKAVEKITGNPLPLVVGGTLQVDPNLYDRADFTVVLFARSTCPVCTAAKPHLRTFLTELSKYSTGPVYLMYTQGSPESELPYASAIGINASNVLSAPESVLRQVTAVPTLILVDRAGRVLFKNGVGFRNDGQALTLLGKIVKTVGLKQPLGPLGPS